MTHATDADLKRTPLHARHRALGARMIAFGGWEMPVEYSGITDEHMAVRTGVGLLDVSHMGEIEIAGDDALEAVQKLTSNDASRLDVGQAQYSVLMAHDGTCVDDLLVFRLADAHYLLVINAANIAKDAGWIKQEIASFGDAVSVNSSSRYALLAVQGPLARDVLQPLTGVELGRFAVTDDMPAMTPWRRLACSRPWPDCARPSRGPPRPSAALRRPPAGGGRRPRAERHPDSSATWTETRTFGARPNRTGLTTCCALNDNCTNLFGR